MRLRKIWVGIEWFDLPCPDDAVESGPGDQRGETQGYERPGPTKRGDAIGQAIAKGLLFRKGTVDVPADLSSLGDARDHPALAF